MTLDSILVIVPCGKAKIWNAQPKAGPTAARLAYTGAPFVVNRRYAERFASQWRILSAKYGFLAPEDPLPGPYNVSFKDRTSGPVSGRVLQEQVQQQDLQRFETIIGLGGKEYRAAIEEAFRPWPVQVLFPFAGLPLGLAMQAVTRAIEANTMLPKTPVR